VGFLVEPQNQGQRFVSGLASKPLRRFLLIWPQNRWPGFLGLGLKIGSSNLLIYPSKSPRQFLGLDIKTKRALIYRLHHKIDGGRTAWDMRRDLVACFNMKQVWPQDWWRRDDGWCTWYHCGDHVELKMKTDGSMRQATSNPSAPKSSFSMY
jgi:hypothetical protein